MWSDYDNNTAVQAGMTLVMRSVHGPLDRTPGPLEPTEAMSLVSEYRRKYGNAAIVYVTDEE